LPRSADINAFSRFLREEDDAPTEEVPMGHVLVRLADTGVSEVEDLADAREDLPALREALLTLRNLGLVVLEADWREVRLTAEGQRIAEQQRA
jgi:predicted methyltransferase